MDCPENMAFRLKMICLVCERRKQMMNATAKKEGKYYVGNKNPTKITMKNKVIREKSKCTQCLSGKSRFLK